MYHLDNESGVGTMPPISGVSSATLQWFTESPPSYPGADWFNVVQAELLNVLKDAAIEPQKNALNQLSQAIQSMIFSGLPVGIPLPYPAAIPPSGFLKCNGAAFNKTQYPKLALVYPLGVLPDLRGEFIRGWDDGRSVDSGRVLLSSQSDEFKKFVLKYLGPASSGSPTTTIAISTNPGGGIYTTGINQTSGVVDAFQVPGGTETRPRNIAFNYIVRAA